MIGRFRKASIRTQFMVFASIVPLLVLCLIAILPEPFIFQNEKMLIGKGAQIELLVHQVRGARNDAEIEHLVRASASSSLELKVLPWSDISSELARQTDDHLISDALQDVLPADFEAVVLENTSDGEGHSTVAVRLDAQRALVIGFAGADVSSSSFSAVVEFIAKANILMLPILLLVLYISRMITSPLVRFADAAKRLRLDGNEGEQFTAEGARELRTLATALNNMRHRIRKMVDDRTRMLTAVSHDLRTPLTRLRMRVERSKDPASREAMLADIDNLTTMIEESLQYLSSTVTAEPLRKVDISSLLRTIASEFCDLGHDVIYCGPERFGYVCQQKALIRAITNIVENAARFGTKVAVELRNSPQGGAVIVVSDNGPGLEEGLQDKVLEPFFKVDEARSLNSSSGFGLGLSIADEIIKGHGGSLLLENVLPHGLRVTLQLRPVETIPHRSSQASSAREQAPAQEVLVKQR
ncbi:sensor histidine kinase [Neorhizobium galegae]|uniref:sensor histidine kinase n=1 Tax=Neorhizobium galegae TaxID=399 RepID=UPI000621AC9D|nr:ATP-binding protein [Neorhizobium galegae]KAB1120334.1 HAMP domain-containing protein [Neorhizobium galegae]MCQ1809146.1 ATP-binding protein [Neorhizobium galegae]CDZ63891.1 Histidine kinase [Neorhizobium galegae bv. orientalis]